MPSTKKRKPWEARECKYTSTRKMFERHKLMMALSQVLGMWIVIRMFHDRLGRFVIASCKSNRYCNYWKLEVVQQYLVLQLLETQGYRERDNGMNSPRFSSVDRYLRVSNGYRKSRLFLEFQLSGKSFAIINIGWILLAIFVSRTGKTTTNSNTAENIVDPNQRLSRNTHLPTT